jgi:DNA-binding transcriptional regulator YhcF (GntR family)
VAGAALPPLRRAATQWGVNLHTVRRAYQELASNSLVVTRAPGGTQVLPARAERPRPRERSDRDQFVKAVVSEARLRHGLEPRELAALVRAVKPTAPRLAVSVLECSRTQCDDLAGQIAERWRVDAVPWVLGAKEPPRGLAIATYFHYNDIRRSWPERLPEVSFLPIAPEPELAGRLASRRRAARGPLGVVLCERDEAMARNIAADLVRILPAAQFRVVTQVVARPEDGLATDSAAVLFSPRLWGELPERARRDQRVHQVRYVFDRGALDALAAEQGWEPA